MESGQKMGSLGKIHPEMEIFPEPSLTGIRMSDAKCVCSSGLNTRKRMAWQIGPLKAKAGKENGRRADLHFQQTSIPFHDGAIKQSWQGKVSLGAFQDQSTSSSGISLLPGDQYFSSTSPI